MTCIGKILRNTCGSVSVSTSLALIPLIAVTGLAIDYSNSVRERYRLQQVLDSTATALAADGDLSSLSQSARVARAVTYAQSLSGGIALRDLALSVAVTPDDVTVRGSGQSALIFGQIFGQDTREVSASVTVLRGKMSKIELALVLDNTASMRGAKITQLRAAVKALVDFFEPRISRPGDVKVSMVPFTNSVRTSKEWFPSWMLFSSPPNNWTGCVRDRAAPYDVTDQPPRSGVGDSLYWWVSSCDQLAEIIPLTNDLSKIRKAADSMIASGTTNVPLGMIWGWHSLSAQAPLVQGSQDSEQNLIRAMIVLTDGENTEHRWAKGANAIDDRLRITCDNVKKANITVFTVRVIDGNAGLLRECASSGSHYFNVTNANQLTPVFEQIASTMSKMRISK